MIDYGIVCTRKDGGVSVVYPSDEVVGWLARGGWFERAARDWEIHKWHRVHGLPEQVAARWVDALIDGGLSEREAIQLVAEKDARDQATMEPFAGQEVWHRSDILADRWFRDAWRRSANGGPIDIDMKKARRIQAEKFVHVQERLLKSLQRQASIALVAGEDAEASGLARRRDKIEGLSLPLTWGSAETPEQLRAMWPAALS